LGGGGATIAGEVVCEGVDTAELDRMDMRRDCFEGNGRAKRCERRQSDIVVRIKKATFGRVIQLDGTCVGSRVFRL
jgi:hypothetical protein